MSNMETSIIKSGIAQSVCQDCKDRSVNEKSIVSKPEKELTASVFKTRIVKDIYEFGRTLHSIDHIKCILLQRYPECEKYITHAMVKSYLKSMLKLCINTQHSLIATQTLDIEVEHSIFVSEANINIKSTNHDSIHMHVMCAITSKGLFKLDVGVQEKQCGQLFIKMILNKLEQRKKSFQIVIKSTLPDRVEIEKLFTRYSSHTLVYYPSTVDSVASPARKYIRTLAEHIPKNIRVHSLSQVELMFKEAEEKISKRACKRWIEKYLRNT